MLIEELADDYFYIWEAREIGYNIIGKKDNILLDNMLEDLIKSGYVGIYFTSDSGKNFSKLEEGFDQERALNVMQSRYEEPGIRLALCSTDEGLEQLRLRGNAGDTIPN